MSHIQALGTAKEKCNTTKDCNEYQFLLREENTKVDASTMASAQLVAGAGLFVVVIGLFVLLAGYVESIRKFQAFLLPKLVVAAPILIGLISGAFFGFIIAFSACFKQTCSFLESTAMFTMPLLTLVVSIPLARLVNRNSLSMKMAILDSKQRVWIIAGMAIIALAVLYTLSGVASSVQRGEQQKSYLQASEL